MGLKAECKACGRCAPARDVDHDALARHMPQDWTVVDGIEAACSSACARGGPEATCTNCRTPVTVIDPDGGGFDLRPGSQPGIVVLLPLGKRAAMSAYACLGCVGRIVSKAFATKAAGAP